MAGMNNQARLAALLDRTAKCAAILFFVTFGLLMVAGGSMPFSHWVAVSVILMMLAMIVAAIVFILAITLRDVVQQRWRFSVSWLLGVTTLIAMVFGAISILLRAR
jgi:hypothetical protein